MRFVCDKCRAQYMISDDKVGAKGAKGVKIKCKKCGHVIVVRPAGAAAPKDEGAVAAPGADAPAEAAATNGSASSQGLGIPASIGTPPEGGLFTDVEEDEIGAVFDQVLNSGSQKLPAGDSADGAGKSSTLAAVSRMAEAEAEPDEPKEEPPASEWYVAIDEKQVGPLTVEAVKEHWDRGEVGPDSLCWRQGFGDWIPLSEATELASVLAPRPARPVIVAPAAVAAPTAPAPVESAFSAGAAAKNTRPEIPAAPALGAEPSSSGWKPSAASVLASLVKEENEALAKPPPKPASVVEEKPATGGLLDLPPPEPVAAPAAPVMAAVAAEPVRHAPQPAAMAYAPPAPAPAYAQPAPAYPQPAFSPGYPQPAYPGYPPPAVAAPQAGNNKLFVVVGIAAAVLVLGGIGLVVALREPAVPPAQPDEPAAVAAVTPSPAPPAKPAEAPSTPTPANTAPPAAPPSEAVAAATPPPDAAPAAAPPSTPPAPAAEAPTPPKPAEPARADPPAVARVDRRESPRSSSSKSRSNSSDSVASARSRSSPSKDDLDDDFDKLFGKSKSEPKSESKSTPSTYVPPEPGSRVPERLAQSDIMAVVLANKPAIVRCVNEQKKRDPGISGKLVMRWTIQTSGRTTGVAVRTDEFRKTYMASCITGLIKGWSFPKHRKQGAPIDFPFTF